VRSVTPWQFQLPDLGLCAFELAMGGKPTLENFFLIKLLPEIDKLPSQPSWLSDFVLLL